MQPVQLHIAVQQQHEDSLIAKVSSRSHSEDGFQIIMKPLYSSSAATSAADELHVVQYIWLGVFPSFSE